MDIYSTRPTKEIDKFRFKKLLSNKKIMISPHAMDHLSEAQRKVFKEEELIHMLKREGARKIYLQKNGRYSSYHRKKDGYRKLILAIEKDKIIIVSFIDTLEIPKIKL